MNFIAILAFVSNSVFLHLLMALRTAAIDYFVVDSNMLYEGADFVELWFLLFSVDVLIIITGDLI